MRKELKRLIMPTIANKSKLDIRKERVYQFFNEERWRDYKKISEWPIKNDIVFLRKYTSFEYEYQYNYITYYEYQSQTAFPPIEPKDDHFWCRYCREEKPITESRGITPTGKTTSICIPCAKKYRRENYREIEAKRMKEKYHRNAEHRLGCVIKAHITHIIKGKFNKIRDKKWEDIVGLSKQEFLDYIISMLPEEWTMDNYGTVWVIQHIIPRDWAENESDGYLLNYHKNLMPLSFSENSSLRNRIDESQLNHWHFENKRIQELLNIHDLRYVTI
jgi:hypothetical protein